MTKTKISVIFASFFLIVAGIIFLINLSASWTYSEGSRSGVIIKLSHKGMWFKTWEGEMIVGPLNNVNAREKWNFSINENVDGEGIVKAAEKALESGERVKVHYREQNSVQNWKGDTPYFVTKIEYLEK